jgi:hypothetical protein
MDFWRLERHTDAGQVDKQTLDVREGTRWFTGKEGGGGTEGGGGDREGGRARRGKRVEDGWERKEVSR